MEKAKCLVCGESIPWLQKLGSNNQVGIECSRCHSLMKHSSSHLLIVFVLILCGALVLAKYGIVSNTLIHVMGWALSISALIILAKAKLILVYHNKHHHKVD